MFLPNQTSPLTILDQYNCCLGKVGGAYRDGKVVKLQDIWNGTESFLEVSDLLESVSKLYNWSLHEHAIMTHHELAVLKRVEVRRN
jgi:hypothetical protein